MGHLLFLAHRVPFPPNKGDKIRSFNEIAHLAAAGWRIHLASLADVPEDLEHWQALKQHCASVFLAPISPLRQKALSFAGPLRGDPLSAPYFYSHALQRRVDQVLDRYPVHAVFCFSGPMAEYVFRSRSEKLSHPRRHGTRLVMDLVDVDSDKWTQYGSRSGWPLSWVYRLEGRLLARYEARIARAFDATVLVSEAEAALFRRRTDVPDRIHAVGNGVDLAFFRPPDGPPRRGDGPSFVFCGAMDYFPNVDAVVWFAREVLPLVRRDFPSARFTVVGSNPDPRVLALEGIPGVTVTGRVADVRPPVAAADISVAPIRVARGIQNKVLEAMALAKPVVASPQAFEGIEAEPGSDLEVVKLDPKSWADALTALWNDPDRAEAMGRAGRSCVERRYSWRARLSSLDELIDTSLSSPVLAAGA